MSFNTFLPVAVEVRVLKKLSYFQCFQQNPQTTLSCIVRSSFDSQSSALQTESALCLQSQAIAQKHIGLWGSGTASFVGWREEPAD